MNADLHIIRTVIKEGTGTINRRTFLSVWADTLTIEQIDTLMLIRDSGGLTIALNWRGAAWSYSGTLSEMLTRISEHAAAESWPDGQEKYFRRMATSAAHAAIADMLERGMQS